MLKVDNISVYYGPVRVLSNISFDSYDGEVLAIVGPNGHGKTTLLKAIAGINPPVAGDIWYNGEKISKLPPHEIARKGVFLLPEGGGYIPNLTVIENLKLGAYTQRNTLEERLNKVYEIFPWLKTRSNQLSWTLSGGERRMLAIARCLVGNGKLLLLDEPTWGVSPKVQKEISEVICKLRGEEYSFMIAESNLFFASQLSDRLLLLKNNTLTPLDKDSIENEKLTKFL
ncbi:MAG: ABC transporter ATP-binding protein [Nitrososphaerota archaeon]